jgi:hypothetical protein
LFEEQNIHKEDNAMLVFFLINLYIGRMKCKNNGYVDCAIL